MKFFEDDFKFTVTIPGAFLKVFISMSLILKVFSLNLCSDNSVKWVYLFENKCIWLYLYFVLFSHSFNPYPQGGGADSAHPMGLPYRLPCLLHFVWYKSVMLCAKCFWNIRIQFIAFATNLKKNIKYELRQNSMQIIKKL